MSNVPLKAWSYPETELSVRTIGLKLQGAFFYTAKLSFLSLNAESLQVFSTVLEHGTDGSCFKTSASTDIKSDDVYPPADSRVKICTM